MLPRSSPHIARTLNAPEKMRPVSVDGPRLKSIIDCMKNRDTKLRAKRCTDGGWLVTFVDRKKDDPELSYGQMRRNREEAVIALNDMGFINDEHPGVYAWIMEPRELEIGRTSLEALLSLVPSRAQVSEKASVEGVLSPSRQAAREVLDLLGKFAPMELVLDLMRQTCGGPGTTYAEFHDVQHEFNTKYKMLRPQDPVDAAAFEEFIRKGLFEKLNASQEQVNRCMSNPAAWTSGALQARNDFATTCALQAMGAMKETNHSFSPPIGETLTMLKYVWNQKVVIPRNVEGKFKEMHRTFTAQFPNDGAAFVAAFRETLLNELPESLCNELKKAEGGHATYGERKAAVVEKLGNLTAAQRVRMFDSRSQILKQWPVGDKKSERAHVLRLLRLTVGGETVPDKVYQAYAKESKAFKIDCPTQSFGANLRPLLVELLPSAAQVSYEKLMRDLAGKSVGEQGAAIREWANTMESADVG